MLDNNRDNDLSILLKENLRVSEEILGLVLYIKKYIFWQRVFSYIKIFLIFAPLVFALVYLIPFLSTVSSSFFELSGAFKGLYDELGSQ